MMESSSADESIGNMSKLDMQDTSGCHRATSTPIDKWSKSCPSLSMMANGDSSDVCGDQSDDLGGHSSLGADVHAPKYGTLVPNRIFVGGISSQTTEEELTELFSPFGQVRATKIIVDRAGVSKGYGFVTFETEEEAKHLYNAINDKEMQPIIHRERRLNIAPAVKKQASLSDGLNRHEIQFGNSLEPITSPPYNGATSYYYPPSQPSNGQYYTQQNYDTYYNQLGGSCTYQQAQQSLPTVYSAPPSQLCYLQGYQPYPQVQAPYLPVPGQITSVGPSQSQLYGSTSITSVPQAYVDQNGHNGPWMTSTGVPISMTNLSSAWTNVPMYREVETTTHHQVHESADVCNCVMHSGAMQINSY